MIDTLSAFLTGFALCGALILSIGAQNIFVLRQGLRGEHVGAIVLFCGSADTLLMSAGVGGLGALLALLPGLARLLTFGGAAFLGCYGLTALRRAMDGEAMHMDAREPLTLGGALTATAAFTFLNPHVYLDTVLLMGAAGSAQPVALRPWFVAGAASASFAWFAGLGYGARLLVPLFARPAAWRMLDLLVGVTMLALAASLLVRAVAA